MLYIFLTVIIIAIGLFISSFFFKNQLQSLEEQLEQMSITTMQDSYQLKKKIKVLEEELLSNEPISTQTTSQASVDTANIFQNKPLVVQKIHHLHEQGFSIEDISEKTNLSMHDVQTILKHQI